jgi:hypothetical protein
MMQRAFLSFNSEYQYVQRILNEHKRPPLDTSRVTTKGEIKLKIFCGNYVEIKCELDATDAFLLQILLLAQHVSGAPLCPSSGALALLTEASQTATFIPYT